MTWIYIQTSISEGLPVSVIEAGLTGKPVVCTNVGGCAELLANPNSGGWARGLLLLAVPVARGAVRRAS
jgi:glycosyltransferase involved in cell wall biosynthesis